ncbi:hypothetical protein ILUMI_02304 [Ignelater luminosus]|uniref:Uncharacterized protein n=1 Tax=Ignelater luminosus TaxID=2038154 RepID=A0A8K0DHW9_IGNLU|nr:hypothetical protein ILUMI_02304 [Ignelater luminosus]
MNIVREKASTTNNNPQQLIGEATGEISESVQAISKTTNLAPCAPTSLSELVIDSPYSKTSSGEDFLLFNSEAGDSNHLNITQFIAERGARLGRKKYRITSDEILRIVERYGKNDLDLYLRGLAHHFDIQKN